MRAVVLLVVGACGFSSRLGVTRDDDVQEPDASIDALLPDAPVQAAACADLALGSDHSCALRGGNVYCWGSASFGVLGGGTATMAVPGLPATKHLTSSKYTNCAVANDGSVRCWGMNDNGQLGNGIVGGSTALVQLVMGMTGAVQAGAGRSQACARRMDGTIRCWGGNGSGQLGDGTTVSQSTAVADVMSLTGMVDVRFTASHVCARNAGGAAMCWGDNSYGQLGDGTTTDALLPIAAPLAGVSWIGTASFSSGADVGAHTCAIKNGEVWCWGDNAFGQLGNGTQTDSPAPVLATSIIDAVELVMGRWHVCARRASGQVSCWGRNLNGEVGNGSTAVRTSPVDVGLTNVLELDAGGHHNCALTASKALYCWGLNSSGQLGIVTNPLAQHLTPTLAFTLCP